MEGGTGVSRQGQELSFVIHLRERQSFALEDLSTHLASFTYIQVIANSIKETRITHSGSFLLSFQSSGQFSVMLPVKPKKTCYCRF